MTSSSHRRSVALHDSLESGPLPSYLEENRQNYRGGLEAAQRAVAVATPEGKSYAEYWAKRMEFSVRFIDVRRVCAARRERGGSAPGPTGSCGSHEGLDHHSGVHRSLCGGRAQPDRPWAIALAVEYGYRPLEKKLAELKQGTNMQGRNRTRKPGEGDSTLMTRRKFLKS